MLANTHLLPDSRLHGGDSGLGCFMADWPLPGGSSVRIEVQPIFCGNCGKEYGHVPKDNTSFCFYLCNKCFENYGAIAGTYAVPDDEFNAKLSAEMMDRFGRGLTHVELWQLEQQGRLGTALEKLARESPYPNPE